MTIKDINTIIETLCPNDEDYEKPCISPKYLRQELEQLALEQEQRMVEPTTRNCFGCKYSKDNHNAGTEECHLCMWENQYTPTTKNDLAVDYIDRAQAQTEIEMNASRYTIAKERGGMGQVEWSDQLIKVSDAVDIIRNLPSVTPQLCEDAISRQALLNATVHKNSIWNKTTDSKGENLETIISKLPSITPQPRKGHWEHGRELSRIFMGNVLKGIDYENWHCSNCHCVVEQSIKPDWNYCPFCGADMREVEV